MKVEVQVTEVTTMNTEKEIVLVYYTCKLRPELQIL